MPHHTLHELTGMWAVDRTSLGIIRPAEVLDLEVTKGEEKWAPKHEAKRAQPLLFGKRKELHRIPYEFRYVFRCEDCPEPHRLMLEDWELGALFLKERERKGEEAAAQSIRQKFLEELCDPTKDTRFFVGTRHPLNQWLVIGVFYPPREQKLDQPLFS